MRLLSFFCMFLFFSLLAGAQSSIPDELLRPKRGESPRYPIDTVIGELGRGAAPDAAYSFANSIATGFLSLNMENPALASVNSVLRESYFSILETIEPRSFRIGGGRTEPDGAVSFLIRFIGKEKGITGELFLRAETAQTVLSMLPFLASEDDDAGYPGDEVNSEEEAEAVIVKSWKFDELILEEARNREDEEKDAATQLERQRFDFSPYERFF